MAPWPPWLLGVAMLAACASKSAPEPGVPDPDPGADSQDLANLAPARAVDDGRFATSLVCADCHSNSVDADAMRDERDQAVAPFDLWAATMMANAARDPLWRAVVSAEAKATPSRAAEIEATCMGCHSPMAATEARLNEEAPVELSLLYRDTARAQLALDGVSCAACHQIRDEGLGTAASFSGKFKIGDDREIFGPHSRPFSMPMERRAGFLPVQSSHVSSSALCASCHTLHTRAFRPDGSETGDILAEQAPYLEWRNSAFTTEVAVPGPLAADCQDCHMPSRSEAGVAIATAIARHPDGSDFPPIDWRSPFGRHVFVGGNTLIPQILRDNRTELSPIATTEEFDATIELARAQLRTKTADIAIENPRVAGGRVTATVVLNNLTGHKFPTAHPSRRAWLRVAITDGSGVLRFESGRHSAAGVLVDAGDNPLPSERAGGPALLHRSQIDRSSGPQVYETVMADADGAVTYRLLHGARYLKDNRLLPLGWSPAAVTTDIAAVGVSDSDFVGGSDRVALDVDIGDADAPISITVSLVYQSLSARYAAELFAVDTPEVRAFKSMYERSDRTPALVARATADAVP